MVEFRTAYSPPFEQSFDREEQIALGEQDVIEKPIMPISEIGTTAIDVGQTGNVLQNLDQNIRMGTKKIQLIISGGGQGNPSVLTSSLGKDVRREIKEKMASTGVELTGVELSPQRVSSMSGMNRQNGTINDQQRFQDLREVKYAVKFAAEVAGGGGVDIWSQEFERNIFDAPWNKKDAVTGKQMFFDNGQEELDNISKAQLTKYLIDTRTGQMQRDSMLHTNVPLHLVQYERGTDVPHLLGKPDKNGHILTEKDYIDIEGNRINRFDPEDILKLVPKIDDKTKNFVAERYDWDRIERETKEYNKLHRPEGQPELLPEEWAYRLKILTNIASTGGYARYYHQGVDQDIKKIREQTLHKRQMQEKEKHMTERQKRRWIKDQWENHDRLTGTKLSDGDLQEFLKGNPSDYIENVQIARTRIPLEGFQELVTTYTQQKKELIDTFYHVKAPWNYAREKTFDSYSEAGIYAMEVTEEEGTKKPVYVGPEIGFAGQSYGGHPDEFIEIVKESRNKMQQKLIAKGYAPEDAKERSKKHIKGMLDTSHLTMWYKHFAKHENESEESRLTRFNKWATDQVRTMVDEKVVGAIQVVDSITGEHSHLPPGQGIFKVANLVKEMKKKGWDGPVVSEGHEEEQFTKGRILTEAWRSFGSPIGNVSPGQKPGTATFGGIQYGYFGFRSPQTYIVGSYSPSNEWSLWSETPME
ncbi:MAG: TIM barrel protein [Candidatus Woesearchaeota archaeon]|nr:TIM barrel protein [Candidatus Woesearchaeota archaeon]